MESNYYEASSQLVHTTPFRRLIHLFITRAQAIGTGHILRRVFFCFVLLFFLSELVLSLFRWRRVSSRAKNSTKHAKDNFLRKKYLHLKIKARSLFLQSCNKIHKISAIARSLFFFRTPLKLSSIKQEKKISNHKN